MTRRFTRSRPPLWMVDLHFAAALRYFANTPQPDCVGGCSFCVRLVAASFLTQRPSRQVLAAYLRKHGLATHGRKEVLRERIKDYQVYVRALPDRGWSGART